MLKALSDATGGDSAQGGVININPDALNHLMRGYFGGLYSTLSRTTDALMAASDSDPDNNPTASDIPVLSSFFKSTDDSPVIPAYLSRRYYDRLNELEELDATYKDYKAYREKVSSGSGEARIIDVYTNRSMYPRAFAALTDEQKAWAEEMSAALHRNPKLAFAHEMLESEEYKGTVMRTKMGLPYSNDRRQRDGLSHAIEDLKLRLRDPDMKPEEKRVLEQELATAYARFLRLMISG